MLQISSRSKNTPSHQEGIIYERPIDLLLSCHEKILHFSSALFEVSLALKEKGWNEEIKVSISQVRRYFNIAGPDHHLDEEHHLFPAIIALDPELKLPESTEIVHLLNRLIKEHVESDVLWETLDTMLEEESEDFTTLEKLALKFKTTIQEHARIENEQIFPYAIKNINKDELKKIGLAIAERRGIKLL